ncbi:TPA: transposase [Stenotrophomonas maltophilia]|nr:transposase [Stenotrophomonas maltophilia]
MTRNQAIKKSCFTEEQVAYALKQVELGMAGGEVCRELGLGEATFYMWRKKYGGLGPSELKRLRLLEEVKPQAQAVGG